MRNRNKFLKILMIVFIMLLQISCSKVYYNVEEDGKGKIIINYEKETKTFVMKSLEEGSVLSRDKMKEFYKKIDKENMNNEKYTLKLENKIEAPINSSGLFSSGGNNRFLNIKIEGLENLDVSNVRNMSYMFMDTTQLNPNISNWDVSNVTNMGYMFANASQANPDVSRWDVSNVKDMGFMFFYAVKANPDVSIWNVSNVEDMSSMFYGAIQANPNVSRWDVSNVEDMSFMFGNTKKANPDVSRWDVSNVTNMSSMFESAEKAEPDVSKWNVGNVNVYMMFGGTNQAKPDISSWDLSNVENIKYMFEEVSQYISETEAKIERLENKTEAEKKELKSYIDDGNVEHLKKLIYELNKSKK